MPFPTRLELHNAYLMEQEARLQRMYLTIHNYYMRRLAVPKIKKMKRHHIKTKFWCCHRSKYYKRVKKSRDRKLRESRSKFLP